MITCEAPIGLQTALTNIAHVACDKPLSRCTAFGAAQRGQHT